MVAIEIFGFGRSEAHKIESQIFSLLRDQGCVKQLVVVIHSSSSRNAQRIDQPFLKISAMPGIVSTGGAIKELRRAGFKVLVNHLSPASEIIMPRIKKREKEKKRGRTGQLVHS